jgi:hypothetical protein
MTVSKGRFNPDNPAKENEPAVFAVTSKWRRINYQRDVGRDG